MSDSEKEQLLTIIRESWQQFSTNTAQRREYLLSRLNAWRSEDLREAMLWLVLKKRVFIIERYKSRLEFIDVNTWMQDVVDAVLHAEIVV